MKIIYTITNEDVVKFNVQHLNKLARIKKVQKKKPNYHFFFVWCDRNYMVYL